MEQTQQPRPQRAIRAGIVGIVFALVGALVHQWEPDPRDPNLGYWDSAGHAATACNGHTGPDVKVGKRYTDAQCEAWRQADIAEAVADVQRCIHVELTPGQAAALTDAAFNLGPVVVCDSTLQRLANAGQPPSIWCAQLKRWNKAGGRELTGLTHRRADEFQLCIGATP